MLEKTLLVNFVDKEASNSAMAFAKPALLDRCVLLNAQNFALRRGKRLHHWPPRYNALIDE